MLYYFKLLEDADDKKILKNSYEDDPVTLADLKVNEIINERINQKYRNIKWDILNEENVKTSKNFVTKNDWDFAAPESILKEAGGAITNLDNQELSYGKSSFEQGGIIVATNNKNTHGSICLEIKNIIEDNEIYPL